MKKTIRFAQAAFLIYILTMTASAQQRRETVIRDVEKSVKTEIPAETMSVTQHSVRIDGKNINYTATAGTFIIKEDDVNPTASMFYIAYTKDGVKEPGKRPLLISFNGGPSTASVWLHLGVLGPRKVVYDDDGFAYPPPAKLEDNPWSILDVADIVFLDPVTTGYSRMLPGEDRSKYHGTRGDIESLAEVIRMYITRNKRWESPKFLIGESYGTVRAAGLASHLLRRYTMYINGVILVSMTELSVDIGSDLSHALLLPHYAATAWYHNKLQEDLQSQPLEDVLKQAEKFAMNDYLTALVKGGMIPAEERKTVADQISKLTGLSFEYVCNNNLRISAGRFRKELLREEGLIVGRLDSRYTGIEKERAGDVNTYDPALTDWEAAFASSMQHYLADELNYKSDLHYAIWGNVRPWDTDRSMRTGEMLRDAMYRNRYMRVLVQEGYYDAACDYFTAQYVFSHLDQTGELQDRIDFAFYESGHMMYCHKPSLIKMKKDLVDFIHSALAEE